VFVNTIHPNRAQRTVRLSHVSPDSICHQRAPTCRNPCVRLRQRRRFQRTPLSSQRTGGVSTHQDQTIIASDDRRRDAHESETGTRCRLLSRQPSAPPRSTASSMGHDLERAEPFSSSPTYVTEKEFRTTPPAASPGARARFRAWQRGRRLRRFFQSSYNQQSYLSNLARAHQAKPVVSLGRAAGTTAHGPW